MPQINFPNLYNPPMNNYMNNYNNLNYEFQINELKNQLNEEKNKNQLFYNETIRLNNIINNLNTQIRNMQSDVNTIDSLKKEIEEKNNEIQKYKSRYEISITSINPGENILAINFISNDIPEINHYCLPCKNVDLFIKLEEKLNNDFPQLTEHEIYFEVNKRRIKRFKTLDENQIKNNDTIIIFFNK